MPPLADLRHALKPTTYNPLVYNQIRVCPECAGPIIRSSGCIACQQCGWGRCE